jgi:hypothetical protein
MTTLATLRDRLHEIAATASTAAEALDAGSVGLLSAICWPVSVSPPSASTTHRSISES